MSSTELIAAREQLLQAALRVLTAERAEPHAYHDADAEYADDLLLEAARRLARAAEGEAP